MMRLIFRVVSGLLLVFLWWSPAHGQDGNTHIELFKKGQTVTFESDMHCMDNATALAVTKKLRLCPEKCSLKLEELKKLYDVDLQTLEEKLNLQKEKYTEILARKDRTIDTIQVAAIDEVAKIEGSIWWKVTLGVVGGLAVGVGTTYLIMEYVR